MTHETLGEHLVSAPAQRPLVSVLLIAYNQEDVIADAVRGVLAQTYTPLEILISDDRSSDRTFEVIRQTVSDYAGPHRIEINCNERNIGISAHLSMLARMSHGELLFVAAGDDISVPDRCRRVVEFWLEHDRKPDLIATDLVDLDSHGQTHDRVSPHELTQCRSFEDWLAASPGAVGAAHTWSRRLMERFGDLMPGAMAEDQIMTFRAIMSGGAVNLREPLVLYRRGGLSGKQRWKSVDDFVARIRRTNRFALVEIAQFLRDAETAGVGPLMRQALAAKQARENYTRDLFASNSFGERLRQLQKAKDVKFGFRLRMFLYAACPAVYLPTFAMKRWLSGRGTTK
jgi:glycosyltransferase involved in cell wall biosynthesis